MEEINKDLNFTHHQVKYPRSIISLRNDLHKLNLKIVSYEKKLVILKFEKDSLEQSLRNKIKFFGGKIKWK